MNKKQSSSAKHGRIIDGKNASVFSACGNTRKTAIRPTSKKFVPITGR